MRKLVMGLLGATALVAASNASAQTVQIVAGDTSPVLGINDFQDELAALGLTSITTTGADLILSGDALLTFELLGSESGYSDSFDAGAVSFTENSNFTAWGSMLLGSSAFSAGSLSGDLLFSSLGGLDATVGDAGFGIFWGPNTDFAASNVFYIGYDDQITNPDDDNHDDLVLRVTVTPAVPEPGTWAMMLMGFGAAGYAMRRRRAPVLAQAA